MTSNKKGPGGDVAYIVSIPFSAVLWGMEAGAWLLLAALAPCAIAAGWVKIIFFHRACGPFPPF